MSYCQISFNACTYCTLHTRNETTVRLVHIDVIIFWKKIKTRTFHICSRSLHAMQLVCFTEFILWKDFHSLQTQMTERALESVHILKTCHVLCFVVIWHTKCDYIVCRTQNICIVKASECCTKLKQNWLVSKYLVFLNSFTLQTINLH